MDPMAMDQHRFQPLVKNNLIWSPSYEIIRYSNGLMLEGIIYKYTLETTL